MKHTQYYLIAYLAPHGDNEPCSAIFPGTSADDALCMAYKHDGIESEWVLSIAEVNPWSWLIGKTIESAHILKEAGSSDRGTLEMIFTDGSKCWIEGGYIPQSDEDCEDEYPKIVGLRIIQPDN